MEQLIVKNILKNNKFIFILIITVLCYLDGCTNSRVEKNYF